MNDISRLNGGFCQISALKKETTKVLSVKIRDPFLMDKCSTHEGGRSKYGSTVCSRRDKVNSLVPWYSWYPKENNIYIQKLCFVFFFDFLFSSSSLPPLPFAWHWKCSLINL